MWIREVLLVVLIVGLTSCYPQSRIVNGTNTNINRYPFLVSLKYLFVFHSCGGSIIAPRWILTAAHCVFGYNIYLMSVTYASTYINGFDSHKIAFIKRVYVHEKYNASNYFANDIALLELSGSLVFNNESVGLVNLPQKDYATPQIPRGALGIVVGWGLNESGGSYQHTLQEAKLKIYSDEECNMRHNGVTTTDQICGGVDEGGKGQCTGDSGGPLLQILPSGMVQVGIVSWSKKPCGVYPYPGVYAKVSHYIDWIYDTMNSAKYYFKFQHQSF